MAITSTEIANEQTFITDSNGYFLNQHNSNIQNNLKKSIAQNFYPANMITIKDKSSNVSMKLNHLLFNLFYSVNLQTVLGVTS